MVALLQLITHQADTRRMASLLISLGVSPASQSILFPSDQYLDVFLDGMPPLQGSREPRHQ
jgi:hypothetical protein